MTTKCERSKPQKAVVIRFWKGRGKFSLKIENGKGYLHFRDKKFLRKPEIKDIAAKE